MDGDQQTRYVYGQVEVILTGKTAKREISSQPGRRRSTKTPKYDIKYEIKPVKTDMGDWVKWVHLSDLYEIE